MGDSGLGLRLGCVLVKYQEIVKTRARNLIVKYVLHRNKHQMTTRIQTSGPQAMVFKMMKNALAKKMG